MLQDCQKNLSQREHEVMDFIIQGLSATEISTRIHRSPKTVEKHIHSAKQKLSARNIAQAAAIYVETQGRIFPA